MLKRAFVLKCARVSLLKDVVVAAVVVVVVFVVVVVVVVVCGGVWEWVGSRAVVSDS